MQPVQDVRGKKKMIFVSANINTKKINFKKAILTLLFLDNSHILPRSLSYEIVYIFNKKIFTIPGSLESTKSVWLTGLKWFKCNKNITLNTINIYFRYLMTNSTKYSESYGRMVGPGTTVLSLCSCKFTQNAELLERVTCWQLCPYHLSCTVCKINGLLSFVYGFYGP